MNPQKRQRRAMVRREVAPEAQAKKRISKLRKRVVEKPAAPVEPKQPTERTRRKLPPGTKAAPYWKAAGNAPHTPDTEEES